MLDGGCSQAIVDGPKLPGSYVFLHGNLFCMANTQKRFLHYAYLAHALRTQRCLSRYARGSGWQGG